MRYIYITFILITTLCYSQNSSQSNFLTNGDFEDGLTGWSVNNANNVTATVEETIVNPYTGSTKSIKLDFKNTGSAFAVFKDNRFINKDAGDIRFGFWIKAAVKNTKFRVRKFTTTVDENGANVQNTDDLKMTPLIVLPDENWHYIICNLPNVPASKKVGFQIVSNTTTANTDGVFYVDDFRAHKSSWDPSFEMSSWFVFNNGTADFVVGDTGSILTSGNPTDILYKSAGNNSITMSYSTEQKSSGNRSLKVVNGTGIGIFYYKYLQSYDFHRVSIAENMSVEGSTDYPDIEYTGSFKVMSPDAGAKSDLNFKAGTTNNFSATTTLVNANEWYTVTKKFTKPRSFSGYIYLGPRAKTANATYYFDDMEISWKEAGSLSINLNDLDNNISFSPNPVLNYINIKNYVPGDILEIFNLSGQKILSKKINQDNINLSHLNNGVYLGSIRNNTFKFIKK